MSLAGLALLARESLFPRGTSGKLRHYESESKGLHFLSRATMTLHVKYMSSNPTPISILPTLRSILDCLRRTVCKAFASVPGVPRPPFHEYLFHPAVSSWFGRTFAAPTPAQADAWPAIKSGKHVLIAAPTGSGKTLAAFLAAIDELVREGEQWGLPDETRIVYVSPLKALSNDINKNLEAPLAGIRERLRDHTIRDVDIRTWVRTGDTPQVRARAWCAGVRRTSSSRRLSRCTSCSGRNPDARCSRPTRTVIVDEIHAVAGTKRGSHLSLSLERLEALTGRRLTRIGLSATQKPIEEVARFLVGTRGMPSRRQRRLHDRRQRTRAHAAIWPSNCPTRRSKR